MFFKRKRWRIFFALKQPKHEPKRGESPGRSVVKAGIRKHSASHAAKNVPEQIVIREEQETTEDQAGVQWMDYETCIHRDMLSTRSRTGGLRDGGHCCVLGL